MNYILDCTAPKEVEDNLKKFGRVYLSARLNLKYKSVSTHPDMQIHFLNERLAVCEPTLYEYYRSILPDSIDIRRGDAAVGRTYPEDCAYNIAVVGKNVICNTEFAEKTILDFYQRNNYKIVHINQGYAKCNICPLDESRFITEDAGIYKTTVLIAGLRPILLPVGEVNLEGFDFGFIGGATGRFENEILITGRVENTLCDIFNKQNIKYHTLSNDLPIDLGSLISFT